MSQYIRRELTRFSKHLSVSKMKISIIVDKIVGLFIKMILTAFLVVGSVYQIVTIFQMYLAFPTNTLMVCDFEAETKPLPAISFCAEYHNKTNGRKFDEIFNDFDLNDIIIDIYISFVKRRETDLRHYFLSNITETISQAFYCFTLDSNNHGKLVCSITCTCQT